MDQGPPFTVADFNGSSIGLNMVVGKGDTGNQIEVDRVQYRVHYTPPALTFASALTQPIISTGTAVSSNAFTTAAGNYYIATIYSPQSISIFSQPTTSGISWSLIRSAANTTGTGRVLVYGGTCTASSNATFYFSTQSDFIGGIYITAVANATAGTVVQSIGASSKATTLSAFQDGANNAAYVVAVLPTFQPIPESGYSTLFAGSGNQPSIFYQTGEDRTPSFSYTGSGADSQCAIVALELSSIRSPTPPVEGPISAVIAASTGGTVSWTNPFNALSSNNTYATHTVSTTAANMPYLNLGLFYMAFDELNADSTILGLAVSLERKYTGGTNGNVRDNTVQLMKAGTRVGSNLAATATNWPTTDTIATYGGSTNLWGTTWSGADLVDPNFGISIRVVGNGTNANRVANIDNVTLTVWYAVDSPGTVRKISFTASNSATNSVRAARVRGVKSPPTATMGINAVLVRARSVPAAVLNNLLPVINPTRSRAMQASSTAVNLQHLAVSRVLSAQARSALTNTELAALATIKMIGSQSAGTNAAITGTSRTRNTLAGGTVTGDAANSSTRIRLTYADTATISSPTVNPNRERSTEAQGTVTASLAAELVTVKRLVAHALHQCGATVNGLARISSMAIQAATVAAQFSSATRKRNAVSLGDVATSAELAAARCRNLRAEIQATEWSFLATTRHRRLAGSERTLAAVDMSLTRIALIACAAAVFGASSSEIGRVRTLDATGDKLGDVLSRLQRMRGLLAAPDSGSTQTIDVQRLRSAVVSAGIDTNVSVVIGRLRQLAADVATSCSQSVRLSVYNPDPQSLTVMLEWPEWLNDQGCAVLTTRREEFLIPLGNAASATVQFESTVQTIVPSNWLA